MAIESNGPDTVQRPESGWWTPRLAGPVIAAAVVRFTLLTIALVRSGTGILFLPDTTSYLIPGRNLLLHGRFDAYGVPDLLRTPGYSLFLAFTSLAGFPAAAVVNVLVSVLTVILVWKLGRSVANDGRIALGAAWIFAFEPLSVANSVYLLSETLFLALFLLSLERLAEFLRSRRLRVLAAAGLWLTAATFVRPITYYLPVALALGLFAVLTLSPRRDGSVSWSSGLRWKAPAVLLICTLPWLAAWQVRNKAVAGYSGFSSVSDVNFYFFIATEVTGLVEHRSFFSVREELGYNTNVDPSEQPYLYPPYVAHHPEQAGWTQAQRLAYMHSEAVRVIRAHAGVYLRSCIIPFFVTVFEPGSGSFNSLLSLETSPGKQTWLASRNPVRGAIALAKAYAWVAVEKAVFVIGLLGLYLLAARGAFRGFISRECLWLLLGTSLYFLAISTVAGGMASAARYRLPVMPVVCILAVAGVLRPRAIE